MPYIPHTLYSFRGDLGLSTDPKEEFSFNLRFGQPGIVNPARSAPTQADANAAFTAFGLLIGNTAMQFTGGVRTREVRVYEIGANGKIQATPIIATGTPTSGAAAFRPFQQSVVLSLKSVGLGKGRLGRVYLPPQRADVEVDGLMTATTVNAYLGGALSFVQQLEAITFSDTPPQQLCVAGKTGLFGTLYGVDQLRMGRVVDTQRRRRASLAESYSISTIPA